MSSTREDITGPISSEQLHNRNCFAYLKGLKIEPTVFDLMKSNVKLKNLAQELEEATKHGKYDETFPYADLYTKFLTEIEENIKIFKEKMVVSIDITDKQRQELDEFISSIYKNDNKILETTYAAIKHIPLENKPERDIETSITRSLSGDASFLLKLFRGLLYRANKAKTPVEAGSGLNLLLALMSRNFKPQAITSLPVKRTYAHQPKDQDQHQEIRIGTQAQRHAGKERVSPLFELWLEVQQRLHSNKKHLYFNNLGRDRDKTTLDKIDFLRLGHEGPKEKAMTEVLESLESVHNNIAVITLPADKGLMDKHAYAETSVQHNYKDTFDEFLYIAMEDPSAKHKIKDFHISEKIRKSAEKI
jgi:hypothetical protein